MEQQHVFTKGMNKDFAPAFIQEGQYVEAWNAVNQNPVHGNLYALNNEPGFAQICRNKESVSSSFFLGFVPLNDDIIVFSIRVNSPSDAISRGYLNENTDLKNPALNSPNDLNTATSSEVGIFRKQPEGDFIYEVIVNDKNEVYWDSDNLLLPYTIGRIDPDELWNFDIRYQIQGVARLDYANRPVVYWTDGINPPRYLVLNIDYTDDVNKHTFKELSGQTRLMEVYNLPYIQYNRQISGGNLNTGIYQFAARYLNETLDPTTYGYISNPIPVVQGQRADGRDQYDGGPFDGPTVSKSIELTIHNIDQNYEYLELAVIAYRTPASTPVVRTIQRININERTSIRYLFDGTITGEEITLTELLRLPVVYNTADHILQKDGRLFLANLTTNPVVDLQDMANNLMVRYTVRDIPVSNDQDFFNDYKEENNTTNFKGYRREEVYSFGIVGIFKDGSQSYVHPIPGNSFLSEEEDDTFDQLRQLGQVYSPILFNNDATGSNYNSMGYLNPYISSEYYPDAPLVTKSPPYFYCKQVNPVDGSITGFTQNLTGQHIRYHRMPSVEQEPYILKDVFGNDWIRVLGIQIEGIDSYLATRPDLQKTLLQIVVVRQKRDKLIDKSILSQGCLNKLNYQKGRSINTPTQFDVDYRLGLGKLPIDTVNHLADAIFAIANPLYTIGLNNLTFNGRLESYDIKPTYSVDPYWGNTEIRTFNQAIFYGGDYVPINTDVTKRKDHFSFFSPESNFSKSFSIPGDGWIRPVMQTSGNLERIVNTRIRAFSLFLNGSYNGDFEEPYNSLYRGAYYHLFVDFNNSYIPLKRNDVLQFNIPKYKKVNWNDAVLNNGNVFDLRTKIGELEDTDKLNAYETEGHVLIKTQRLGSSPTDPILVNFYPDNSQSSIRIVVGAKFNILFAPYLPIWLLAIIKDTADYGTPDDIASPLGAGLNKVVRAILFIGNIVIGVAIAIVELVFIRGAVVDVREVKDLNNFARRKTGRYSGFNEITCGGENVEEDQRREELLSQIASLQRQISVLEESKRTYIEQTEKLKIEQSGLQRKIKNRQIDITEKQAQLVKLNKELVDLEERLANASSDSEKDYINGQINRKKQEIKDAENELKVLLDDQVYIDYQKRIDEIDVELAENQQEIDNINQNIAPLREQLDSLNDQLFSITADNCPQTRYVYNVGYNNERQYGQFGANKYMQVGVLFSNRSIQENYEIIRVAGSVESESGGGIKIKELDIDGLIVSVFGRKDLELLPYEESNITAPLFNGDTFITKYFFKVSHNVAYAVPNIGQNNLNRYTLERMYKGGGSLVIGPVFIPIPNFLAFPGSAFAASITDKEGRLFSFIGGLNEDPEVGNSGIESVKIINERVADPLFPAREGMQMRGANWVWLESDINCDYRHRPVSYTESSAKAGGTDQFSNTGDSDNARLGVPYFPKDSLQWCFEVSPEFGQSNGYNQQYSIENSLKPYFSKPFGQVQPSVWSTRIIYSESIDSQATFGKPQKSELSDKYRIFLPFSYQDLPKNKGEITGIFEHGNVMYAHTERSLWRTFVNTRQGIPTNAGELITGNGGVLQEPAKELQTLDGGYAGCLHKWSGVNTPFGYIFADFLQKKVFKIGEGLEEISSIFMYNWFVENMNFLRNSVREEENINYYNNVCNPLGLGLTAFYDPYYKRYVLGIKKIEHRVITSPTSYSVEYDTDNFEIDERTGRDYKRGFSTLSFSIQDNAWVSFHNYIPAISVTKDIDVFSTANLTDNNLYAHNKVVGRNSRTIYGIYGNYYDNNIYPFIISFSINDNPNSSKTYDNLVVYAHMQNEATPESIVHHGDFFNTISCYNDSQRTGEVPIIISGYSRRSDGTLYDKLESNCFIYNQEYRMYIPKSFIEDLDGLESNKQLERYEAIDIFNDDSLDNGTYKPRLKDKYLVVTLTYTNNPNNYNNTVLFSKEQRANLSFAVYSITSKFRINYR